MASAYAPPRPAPIPISARGKRWRYDAVDLPGININISGVDMAQSPTRGRMLDHVGFEVTNLEALCSSSKRRASRSIGRTAGCRRDSASRS